MPDIRHAQRFADTFTGDILIIVSSIWFSSLGGDRWLWLAVPSLFIIKYGMPQFSLYRYSRLIFRYCFNSFAALWAISGRFLQPERSFSHAKLICHRYTCAPLAYFTKCRIYHASIAYLPASFSGRFQMRIVFGASSQLLTIQKVKMMLSSSYISIFPLLHVDEILYHDIDITRFLRLSACPFLLCSLLWHFDLLYWPISLGQADILLLDFQQASLAALSSFTAQNLTICSPISLDISMRWWLFHYHFAFSAPTAGNVLYSQISSHLFKDGRAAYAQQFSAALQKCFIFSCFYGIEYFALYYIFATMLCLFDNDISARLRHRTSH